MGPSVCASVTVPAIELVLPAAADTEIHDAQSNATIAIETIIREYLVKNASAGAKGRHYTEGRLVVWKRAPSHVTATRHRPPRPRRSASR